MEDNSEEQSEPLHVSQNGSIIKFDETGATEKGVQIEYDFATTDLR